MPVISPRRSSTSGSSSLYGSTTSARATGGDSGSSSPSTNRYSSFFERAGSLSKIGSSSALSYTPGSYTSYLNSLANPAYLPRSSTYRSPSGASSYLSGGSSALDSYRSTPSYLSNNDSTSYSRYGLRKTPKHTTEGLTKDTNDQTSGGVIRRNDSKKPPTGAASNPEKRLSTSGSSSSLARLVATSGLDIYEKYSPAHYKPSTELSRSRSVLNDTTIANASNEDNANNGNKNEERERTKRDEAAAITSVTLERPRSRRYSRLYSKGAADENEDSIENVTATIRSRKKSGSKLVESSSNSDIPTATFTLRSNSSQRASKTKSSTQDDTDATDAKPSTSKSTKTIKPTTKCELNGVTKSKPPEICNGVIDDLTNATKSRLRLSSSTSALNNNEPDRPIERSASDSGKKTGGVAIGGDENAIATAQNLEVPTTKSKISPYRAPPVINSWH